MKYGAMPARYVFFAAVEMKNIVKTRRFACSHRMRCGACCNFCNLGLVFVGSV